MTAVKIDYNSYFLNSRLDVIKVLQKMLLSHNYEELCHIANRTKSTFKGLISLSFLKRRSYQKMNGTGFFINRPYEEYVGVLAYIFRQNSNLINEYIKLRENYEKAFLLKEYDKAHECLECIKNISHSTWTLEQDIKLERLRNGLKSCTELYNKLYKECGSLYFYMAYIYYLSSSVEYSFDTEVSLNYNQLKSEVDEDIFGYIVSHCMPYYTYNYSDWVEWDIKSSLLDLYETFIRTLYVIDDKFIQKQDFRKTILIIDNIINDKRLNMYVVKNKIGSYRCSGMDGEREDIIRNYYNGFYYVVVEKYPSYGKKQPYDTSLLDLYVKSLILINAPCPIQTINEDIPIYDRLIYNYYNYLTKKDDNQPLYYRNLITLCHSCYSIFGIAHLLDIINGYEKKDISSLLDEYNRYTYGRSFRGKNDISELDLGFQLRGFKEDPELMELQINPTLLSDNEVFKELVHMVEQNRVSVFIKDHLASYIFKSMLTSQKLKNAVLFFVNNKVQDSKLDIVYDKKQLKLLFEDDFELKNEIPLELSIFYTMIGMEDSKRYMPYKKVLSLYSVKNASDLDPKNNSKLLYFLSHVVDTKVLSLHVQRYDTLDEVYEEQVKICKLLFEKTGESIYSERIAQIYRDQSIRKLTRKIDESKINVDVSKILAEGLSEEKVLFELIKNSDKSMKYYNSLESLIQLLNKDGFNLNVIISLDETNNEKINYTISLFEKLFVSLRDRFLNDPKYGLDFFLSTRIRHGTLINQLRHQFQIYNLVTNIGENNLYKDDKYWVDNIAISQESKLYFLRQHLKKFSASLDASILKLKDEVIQIKTELINSDKQAAFDFSLSQIKPYIRNEFEKCINTDFHNCVNAIFVVLWNITQRRLEEVKMVIDQMQVDICSMLDNLEKDITSELGPEYNLSHFQSAIRNCKTEFQHDTDIVKSWFSINNQSDFSFDIKNVVDASLNVFNRINNQQMCLSLNITSKTMIKGQYFDKFTDIFHDLFNNVSSYCKKVSMALVCRVEVKEIDDYLYIKVSNKLQEKDINNVQTIIDNIKNQEQKLLMAGMGRKEKSSGIIKVSNIVTNLLPGKNRYENSIEDSNFTASIIISIKSIKA